MDVKLVFEKRGERKQIFRLRKPVTVIGRGEGVDLRVPSLEVSRRHCLFRLRDGYVTVEDLNSSNGTLLNKIPLCGREIVRPGDLLRIGPVTFVIEYQLTPEVIDRLLNGEINVDDDEGEVVEEVIEISEPEREPEEPTPVLEAEEEESLPVTDEEVGDWQLPEGENLHDLLSGLEDPDTPKKKKKK
jgi:pSer/pThr/pTyr-binding forkhead associated (FHA) protein